MSEQTTETDQPCPPALRCPDRSLCPPACMAAGSRENPNHRPTRHPADKSAPYPWEVDRDATERTLALHWSYTISDDPESDKWLCECGAVIWDGRTTDDGRDLDDEMRAHVATVLVSSPPEQGAPR